MIDTLMRYVGTLVLAAACVVMLACRSSQPRETGLTFRHIAKYPKGYGSDSRTTFRLELDGARARLSEHFQNARGHSSSRDYVGTATENDAGFVLNLTEKTNRDSQVRLQCERTTIWPHDVGASLRLRCDAKSDEIEIWTTGSHPLPGIVCTRLSGAPVFDVHEWTFADVPIEYLQEACCAYDFCVLHGGIRIGR
jgi:hypothetical protein